VIFRRGVASVDIMVSVMRSGVVGCC
jgi:hypothetical protein